jgi:hypothetical protein
LWQGTAQLEYKESTNFLRQEKGKSNENKIKQPGCNCLFQFNKTKLD